MPIPETHADVRSFRSFDEIDAHAHAAFGLTDSEMVLIKDFLTYTLPEALRKNKAPGKRPTRRVAPGGSMEPELSAYVHTFARVVKATFSAKRGVAATIFAEPAGSTLPVRMAMFQMNVHGPESVIVERISADGLLDLLTQLHKRQLSRRPIDAGGRPGFHRVMFFLETRRDGQQPSMSLSVIKPDEVRYWTRSMAMRDADQFAGAIFRAANLRSTA